MVRTVLEKMVDLATAGFGLVAALAWNDLIKQVIQDFIAPYVPKGWGLFSMVLYALVVTALAVWVTSYLGKLVAIRKDKEEDRAEGAALDEAPQPLVLRSEDIEEAIFRAMVRFRKMDKE
ncbi:MULTISPECIES: DUF5654 family protein [Kyrpidia]|uniref:Mechanosensitive ion channel protein MscL n=1 Tax=Kyrpidia spormannii TaxID=2055160 RepID=A0A6F9E436_9BACL|nr:MULTISPECIES: DUF5654 family protein [Kyrpidia]MCL6577006.1 DUF5654 family protein [Kyrpidia sp.]CAB3391255.1 conserved protein of unknown function [Kyrpidia spormannii]HHY67997.1 hypothetical protein [Alicyclobacillus sp.]